MSYSIPILLIGFNRPDVLRRVFDKVREVKPTRLYIGVDGPRAHKQGEAELVAQCQQLANEVDWDCEVKTLFRDKNEGCRKAVAGNIKWFFEHEEYGVILEDDCLPNDSFFKYMAEVLPKYKDNDRIMMASGDNFQGGNMRGNASYYFSRFPHIWGWGSWRRAWAKYDENISDYPQFLKQGIFHDLFPNDPASHEFWGANFKAVYDNKLDTWDYQFVYSIFKHDGLCIAPNYNMITNIGFRADATHTFNEADEFANVPTKEISKIKHPDFIVIDYDADQYSRNFVFHIAHDIKRTLLRRALRKIKRKVAQYI